MPSIFQIIKKGTTAAAGGNTLCDINQIVISLFGGKRNLKRASAYAAGKPTMIAIVLPLILCLLAQRYIVRGLTLGAVKG